MRTTPSQLTAKINKNLAPGDLESPLPVWKGDSRGRQTMGTKKRPAEFEGTYKKSRGLGIKLPT